MSSPPATNRWLIRLQQIASILFFIYVLALLGRSAWKNSENNRKLASLKTTIQNLEEENTRLENLKVYLGTTSFRELEARQDLQIKRPGEIVLILPDEPKNVETIATTPAEAAKLTTEQYLAAWWHYFVRS